MQGDDIGQFADADGLRHPVMLGAPSLRNAPHDRRPGTDMAKIAIIGGGVIGSSIAYYLALAGHTGDVVVIEPCTSVGARCLLPRT
jgi:NADPH-dependent 2,4-dienoyl-CoA reductase/sulfur reductase-like enzyme